MAAERQAEVVQDHPQRREVVERPQRDTMAEQTPWMPTAQQAEVVALVAHHQPLQEPQQVTAAQEFRILQ